VSRANGDAGVSCAIRIDPWRAAVHSGIVKREPTDVWGRGDSPMIAGSRRRTILSAAVAAAISTACASGPSGTGVAHPSVPEVTHDGLRLVPNSKMERAWVKPGEDFSQYGRVGLLDCFVAFKKDWRLNHPDMHTYDINRIKKELAGEFHKVFSAELEKNGYPIATAPAKDVLLVRPAIINLDIVAPDTESDVTSMTYTADAGSMELYVEFYDSESNEILARAIDYSQVNHIPGAVATSFVTNSADAERLLQHWADLLVSRLDEVHGKTRN